MIKKILTVLATATLVACGGSGSGEFDINGPGGDGTPTSRYVGNYVFCQDRADIKVPPQGTETVLFITEPKANELALSYAINTWTGPTCTGTFTTVIPPVVTFKYRYTNTYTVLGFPDRGNWGTSSVDVGDSSSPPVSSSSVYGLILDQGRLFYAKRKTNDKAEFYFDTVEWYLLKGR